MKRGRGRPPYPELFTPAEERVLELLREGRPNAEIAVRLGISSAGVKYHVSNMLGKAGLTSRDELAKWADSGGRGRRLGLVQRWAALPVIGKLLVGGGAASAVAVAGGVFVSNLVRSESEADWFTNGVVTMGYDGQPANGTSMAPVVSADGRYVVFASDATNLVPGDTNGFSDIFRSTGRRERRSGSRLASTADKRMAFRSGRRFRPTGASSRSPQWPRTWSRMIRTVAPPRRCSTSTCRR